MEDKNNNLNNENKASTGSISDMLKNAAIQQPPALPSKPLPPSNPFKKASNVIAKADSKKNPQGKKNVVAGKAKAPTKKKSMAVGMLAFLLAGGAVFLMMIMMGTKDIKNQDARMSFSYGNVIAGAVAPLFEALGLTETDPSKQEVIAEKMKSHSGKYGKLNINDWLGIKPDSVASIKDSNFGKGSYGGSSGRSASAGTPTHIEKMDSGFSGGFSSSGGGGSSSSSSRDGNSFAQSSVKDAINKNGSGGDASANKYSLKGGKDNAIKYLRGVRQTIGDGLASGSAAMARGNTASVYGQGKAKLAHSGKASGFGNGKLAQSAFNDANAVALDRIESGDIMNLKMSDIDGKNASVPEASVPKKVDSGVDDTKGDSPEDTLAKQSLSAAGDALNSAINSGSDSNSKDGSAGGSDNNPPAEITKITETRPPDGPLMDEVGMDFECDEYTSVLKDNGKPSYKKTEKGTWVAYYTGIETRTYPDGSTQNFEYTMTYVIVPGGAEEMIPYAYTEMGPDGKVEHTPLFDRK